MCWGSVTSFSPNDHHLQFICIKLVELKGPEWVIKWQVSLLFCLLSCAFRPYVSPGLPPSSSPEGRTLQTAEDAGDRPTQAGQDGSAGHPPEWKGFSLHAYWALHLHRHLGAGETKRGQKQRNYKCVITVVVFNVFGLKVTENNAFVT